MGTYIGGRGQHSQRHLSVWVNLCMVNDKNPTYFGMAYISNVIKEDGIKNAKRLEIRKVDIVRLADRTVCSSIHCCFRWARNGFDIGCILLCVLDIHGNGLIGYLAELHERWRCMQPLDAPHV